MVRGRMRGILTSGGEHFALRRHRNQPDERINNSDALTTERNSRKEGECCGWGRG